MIRLKELREESNKTMRQVADELDLPYTTYVNYEKGERKPQPMILVKLAEYFDCTVDYILGRTDDRFFQLSESTPETKKYDIPKDSFIEGLADQLLDLDTEVTADIARLLMLHSNAPEDYRFIALLIRRLSKDLLNIKKT